MKRITYLGLALTCLIVNGIAHADYRETGASYNSNNNTASTINNLQVNNSNNADVFVDGSRCPTPSIVLGGGYTQSQDDWYDEDQNAASATIGLQIPLDQGGVIDDCRKSVAAKRHFTEVKLDMQIIRNCFTAQKEGLHLNPKYFPWASKCEGIIAGNPDYWKHMRMLQQRAEDKRISTQKASMKH